MAKNPAFQFYPSDWARDLEEHSLEIEGAWIRICCKLWWSETRGSLTKTLCQWGRILRVEIDHATEILTYIKNEKIGEISGNLTEPNGDITVKCRRMIRDEKERESNRLRQKRFYEKQKPNGKPNKKLTVPSSVLLSSSSKRKEINKEKKVALEIYENSPRKADKPNTLRSICKLLKAGETKEELIQTQENYKAQIEEDQTPGNRIIQSNNFFGQAQRWREFVKPETEKDETERKPLIIEGKDGKPKTYEEYLGEK